MKSVIFFDLDDTLVEDETHLMACFRAAAELVGERRDLDEIVRVARESARQHLYEGPYAELCSERAIAASALLWSSLDGCHASFDELRAWSVGFRERTWNDALARVGIVDAELARSMSEIFVEQRRSGPPLVEGAHTVLETLASRHRLGLITNGPVDNQLRKLERAGLSDYFTCVVVSGELTGAKPDPIVFSTALLRAGVDVEAAVMIGDNWRRDVLGARGVGMDAIWLGGGREAPGPTDGIVVVEQLLEVLEHFEELDDLDGVPA